MASSSLFAGEAACRQQSGQMEKSRFPCLEHFLNGS